MPSRRHFVTLSSAAALSTGLVARRAFAQATVISRNCRIMVGFPAGSSPDHAWCRANPNLASYGSPGEGTRPHFMAASLGRSAGVPMTHVPYKGFTNWGASTV